MDSAKASIAEAQLNLARVGVVAPSAVAYVFLAGAVHLRHRATVLLDAGDASALAVRAPRRALTSDCVPSDDDASLQDALLMVARTIDERRDGKRDGERTGERDLTESLYLLLFVSLLVQRDPTASDAVASGLAAGTTLVAVRTLAGPVNQLRMRRQLDDGGGWTRRAGGYSGWFRGTAANILRAVPEYGIRFACLHAAEVLASDEEEEEEEERPFLRRLRGHEGLAESSVVAAGAAAAAQLAAHPLHVAHVRMALAPIGTYASVADCLRQTARRRLDVQSAWRALFRGVGPSVAGTAIATALELQAFHYIRSLLLIGTVRLDGREGRVMAAAVTPWSGIGAAALACTAVYPLSVLRTRMIAHDLAAQQHGSVSVYRGAWDCAAAVYRQSGLRGFYRGWTVAVTGWAAFGYLSSQLYPRLYDGLPQAHWA